MSEVVGRDAELASIRDFVASVPDGAAALVLEGEAGMGKTTLWSAGLEAASDASLRVLRARPSESETTLSFSGVGDLLDPVLEQALACLPEAQRRALSRALVLDEDEGPAPDPHAVGVAVLGVLRALSADEPLVVAIDDVQWLDEASSGALAYAGRRLEAECVGLLLARRTGLDSTLLPELRRSLPADRCAALDVGPVDVSALHQIVQGHLDVVLPRPLLAEVHQAAGGNPFYALEIVRMFRRSGVSIEAGHPLPVPETLHELVHGRLLALPDESRDFLLAAAAHAHPTISITEDASGVGRTSVSRRRGRGIVQVDGDTDPLHAPAARGRRVRDGRPARRRAIHAGSPSSSTTPRRAPGSSPPSVEQPDEDVAETLEEAARHAPCPRRASRRPRSCSSARAS